MDRAAVYTGHSTLPLLPAIFDGIHSMTDFSAHRCLGSLCRQIAACLTFVLLTNCFGSSSVDGQELQWITLAADSESGSLWARDTVSVPQQPEGNVVLRIVSSGAVTAYVNGQRMLRNELTAFDASAPSGIEIDVTQLLRTGNNSVAIAVSRDAEQKTNARFAAGLFVRDSSRPLGSAIKWKRTQTPPPVGWQQTDFNDRDWQAGTSADKINLTSVADNGWKSIALATPGSRRRAINFNGFELVDEDHVVLIGATFIERAQQFGHLEAGLTAAVGERRVTFRNLGWSADTVWAESRGIFDTPAQGYQRMIEHVRAEEPSVIIICYGQNEAIQNGASAQSLDSFRQQLTKLIDDVSTTGASVVLMTPHPLLTAPAPLPNPQRFNDAIGQYAETIRQVANDRQCAFVDLFDQTESALSEIDQKLQPANPMADLVLSDHPEIMNERYSQWTDNGMHWNATGYERISSVVRERSFRKRLISANIKIDFSKSQVMAKGAELRNINLSANRQNSIRFELKPLELSPVPTTIDIVSSGYGSSDQFQLRVQSGNDVLMETTSISTLKIETDDGDTGLRFALPSLQYAALRDLVVRKNELYFHRWRPQNITYLFGFRKHEQGNNAVEIAQFDPLIDQLEDEIHSVQQPEWLTLEIKPAQ